MQGKAMMFLRVGKFMFSSTKTTAINGNLKHRNSRAQTYHLPPSKTNSTAYSSSLNLL